MKKIALLMFVVCAALTANAQVYLGGTAAFWHDDDADATTVRIAPEIGYNFSDKWAVGAELGFFHAKATLLNGNIFSIAPYARYSYFESGIVRLFLDGGFGICASKPKGGDSDTGFEIGLSPGLAVKLTDKFSLVGKLGFVGYRDEYLNAGLEGGNGFGLSVVGTDLRFGFQYTF